MERGSRTISKERSTEAVSRSMSYQNMWLSGRGVESFWGNIIWCPGKSFGSTLNALQFLLSCFYLDLSHLFLILCLWSELSVIVGWLKTTCIKRLLCTFIVYHTYSISFFVHVDNLVVLRLSYFTHLPHECIPWDQGSNQPRWFSQVWPLAHGTTYLDTSICRQRDEFLLKFQCFRCRPTHARIWFRQAPSSQWRGRSLYENKSEYHWWPMKYTLHLPCYLTNSIAWGPYVSRINRYIIR